MRVYLAEDAIYVEAETDFERSYLETMRTAELKAIVKTDISSGEAMAIKIRKD